MRAIITGASSGIGLALAQLIADREPDARIMLVGRNLERLNAACRGRPGLHAHAADLTDPAAPAAIVADAVERFGGLDAVVSNAGAIFPGDLSEIDPATFERGFEVNVFATFRLAQAAYRHLKQSCGSIVATGSLAGRNATAHLGAYSPSKAALAMLMAQLALEWGPDGIRSNCISPGTVVTSINAHIYSDERARQERASRIPLRRLGSPQDIAEVIYFLLQPGAAFVNGVDLMVDGGADAMLMPLYLARGDADV